MLIGLNTSVQVLKQDTYTMKTKQKCLVIRDEYLVKSDSNGKLNLLVNDKQKVSNSQVIAKVSTELDDSVNLQVEKLQDEIKELEESKNVLQIAMLSVKKEELQILKNKINSSTSNYYSNKSGTLCYKYDDNEDKYSSQNLENIKKEEIENAVNIYMNTATNNKNIRKDDVIARIVDDSNCYLAFTIKDNKIFNKKDYVEMESNDINIDGQVEEINIKDDYFLIIIKINQQNHAIYDTRVEEFDIIYRKMEALKISKESITEVDGKRGVYVINEENSNPQFVEIKGDYYEDDSNIYVNFRSNIRDGIKTVEVNDRIIIKPNFINQKIKKVN